MSILVGNPFLLNAAETGYQVSRSLRFNSADSAGLSRTFSSAGNRTTWTLSFWTKISSINTSWFLLRVAFGNNDNDHFNIILNTTGTLQISGYNTVWRTTTQVFRDFSAWYHFVIVADTNNGTPDNRLRLYVNGSEITTFSTKNNPSSGATFGVNAAQTHYISEANGYINGYLADIWFLDGIAATPSDFAETDATTGQWIPKAYTGSKGTNGFHLEFADNSAATATTLGKDTSGNSNNWTPVNFQATSSYPVITQAKIYCVYNGGTRGANYSVQYSDDNTNWTTAFTGNMTASACGLITGSGTGNGSYGGHRYWRYVIGAATNDHHPNSARYVLSDGSTDYNIYVYTSDNCSDIGVFGGQGTAYSGQLPLSTSDSLVDTPTSYGTDTGAGGEVRGNYCTWNPLDKGVGTLSNGNLDFSKASNGWDAGMRGTIGVSSGKWYWEITKNNSALYSMYGVAQSNASFTEDYGAPNNETWTYISDTGNKFGDSSGGSGTAYGATFTTGDVIGVALDMTAGTLVFYKNGVSQGTAFSTLAGKTLFPWIDLYSSSDAASVNFGQRAFAYTAPSGFKALVDTNLTAPVIAKPSTVMDVKLYTGNGGTQTITGLGFSPDFVWIKPRSAAYDHIAYDTVRGALKALFPNLTNAENTNFANSLTAFNSDGYTLGGEAQVNQSGVTFASWCWDAGSSTATNTQGSITSSVRANTSAGFSVVTWTGTGSGTYTVGHGLGVAPSFYVVKFRSAGSNWDCYHASLGNAYVISLNTTGASLNRPNRWNSTSPTSTVFSIGTDINDAQDLVAYCFAPVAGYSSFGSYVGNGSSDGVFVYTGHRTRWLMVKRTDDVNQWQILDAARSDYNVADDQLYANLSNAEAVTNDRAIDFLSNGFKLRGDNAGINANGGTYVFASFAESPFQYARAR